jgi:multidrug efflux pump subunit AcrA (membrane-fusion protein)
MATNDELEDVSLLRSQEIDEIVGNPPHWLIQWGISVFFIVLVLVLILSYFIKYPETINVPFSIIADRPSVPVTVNESGKLENLIVKEGMPVRKNEILFYWKGDSNKVTATALSPVDGRAEFILPVNSGRTLAKGKVVLYIIPVEPVYYATVYIGAANIRKIKPGQHVILDVQQYPRQEYGYFNGVIGYISTINTLKGYYTKIMLPQSLKSNTNRIIPVKEGFNGAAEVVVNKQRLIYKLLGKVNL